MSDLIMSGLIDRQAAIKWFEARLKNGVPMPAARSAFQAAIEALKAQDSREPQIIRCENCKHYKEWESEFTPNAVVTQCMADNFPIRKAIPDGWFCAGAERRTDE